MPNDSVLQARTRQFYEWLRVDEGMSHTTALMRSTIVRHALREMEVLVPTAEAVEARKRTMLLAGRHNGYVGNMVLALRNYCAMLGEPDRLASVKMPRRAPRKTIKWLTMQEVQAFLYVIDSVRDRALFSILAYAGLRCAEVLNLKVEDVDLAERVILVRGTQGDVIGGKGGKTATVALGEGAVPSVQAWINQRDKRHELLFYGTRSGGERHEVGARLSSNRVRVLTRRYAKVAGLKKSFGPHAMRHALATNLLANGCPLPFVQRQLRHSRIETTMAYVHLNDTQYRLNFDRFTPDYG